MGSVEAQGRAADTPVAAGESTWQDGGANGATAPAVAASGSDSPLAPQAIASAAETTVPEAPRAAETQWMTDAPGNEDGGKEAALPPLPAPGGLSRFGQPIPWPSVTVLLVLIVLVAGTGVGLVRAMQAAVAPLHQSVVVPTRAVATDTPAPTPTVQKLKVPSATIAFGVTSTALTQQCTGTQPLQAQTIMLDNSGSSIMVDWYMTVQGTIPDVTKPGATKPWAAADPPYGTVLAGQTATITLTPDPTLCQVLLGRGGPVVSKAEINYGGIGSIALTDTITPPAGPSGTPRPTATPRPTPGPSPAPPRRLPRVPQGGEG